MKHDTVQQPCVRPLPFSHILPKIPNSVRISSVTMILKLVAKVGSFWCVHSPLNFLHSFLIQSSLESIEIDITIFILQMKKLKYIKLTSSKYMASNCRPTHSGILSVQTLPLTCFHEALVTQWETDIFHWSSFANHMHEIFKLQSMKKCFEYKNRNAYHNNIF